MPSFDTVAVFSMLYKEEMSEGNSYLLLPFWNGSLRPSYPWPPIKPTLSALSIYTDGPQQTSQYGKGCLKAEESKNQWARKGYSQFAEGMTVSLLCPQCLDRRKGREVRKATNWVKLQCIMKENGGKGGVTWLLVYVHGVFMCESNWPKGNKITRALRTVKMEDISNYTVK